MNKIDLEQLLPTNILDEAIRDLMQFARNLSRVFEALYFNRMYASIRTFAFNFDSGSDSVDTCVEN